MIKKVALLEILIIIVALVAIPYLIGQSTQNIFSVKPEDKIDKSEIALDVLEFVFGKGFVTAQVIDEVWTCPLDNQSSVCQEYISSECDDNCQVECERKGRIESESCSLGYCYDDSVGTCLPNSPRYVCEDSGGTWTEDDLGEFGQCKLGCCKIGIDEEGNIIDSQYVTEKSCSLIAGNLGNLEEQTEWDSAINEVACAELIDRSFDGDCEIGDESVGCGCNDEWGDKRGHGESWCAFDSRIGLIDGRSVDLPGSKHYRKLCLNGEIQTESGDGYRNYICEENKDPENDFTYAALRTNLWQRCIDSNNDPDTLESCRNDEYSDCYIKNVNVDEGFKIDFCVPKHPPGFNTRDEERLKTAEIICKIATQSCQVVYEKTLTGKRCVQNCDCLEPEFAEKMNDLAMSLGDCGAYTNLAGKITTDGYFVQGSEKLSNTYLGDLDSYTIPNRNDKVTPLSLEEKEAILGFSPAPSLGPGIEIETEDDFAEELFDFSLIGIFILAGIEIAVPKAIPSPIMGATLGALVGIVGMSLLLDLLNIKDDLEHDYEELFWLLMLGGALTGSLLFYGAANYGSICAAGGCVAGIVLAAALFLILVGTDIGERETITISFESSTWQPPTGGGDCSLCGATNGICSEAECHSLGQGCEFYGEESGEPECVSAETAGNAQLSPGDISPSEDLLIPGYGFGDRDAGSVEVISLGTGDGCIDENSVVGWGFEIDGRHQCKVTESSNSDYDEIPLFGGSSAYKKLHQEVIVLPSMNSLDKTGAGEEARGTYTRYVKCKDTHGTEGDFYEVKICVKASTIQAPDINGFVPESPYVLTTADTDNVKSVQFYVDQPGAICKWSTQDTSYEQMENTALCFNDDDASTIFGWPCYTEVPLTNKNTYFRCRNFDGSLISSSSEIFTILSESSSSDLEIQVTGPSTKIIGANVPLKVKFGLTTSGGADNNQAICEYSLNKQDYFRFTSTGTSTHELERAFIKAGNYEVTFKCKDKEGNVVSESKEFSIELQNNPPQLTRIYEQPIGTFSIVTDVTASCSYDVNGCSFSFDDGIKISSDSNGLNHNVDVKSQIFVKCKNEANFVSSCYEVSRGY